MREINGALFLKVNFLSYAALFDLALVQFSNKIHITKIK